VADERHPGVADDHIAETLQVAEHPEPVGELRRQYYRIHQGFGYRTFSVVRGRDVVELKQILHRLKLLWPDRAEFPSRAEQPDLDLFDAETAAAVDKFRAAHELPVPADGLGHPTGLVDAPFVKALFAAYRAVIKSSADKGVADGEGAN
jgi:hypothetical protein